MSGAGEGKRLRRKMCSLIRALDLSFWKRKHKRVAENVCLSGPQLSEERMRDKPGVGSGEGRREPHTCVHVFRILFPQPAACLQLSDGKVHWLQCSGNFLDSKFTNDNAISKEKFSNQTVFLRGHVYRMSI